MNILIIGTGKLGYEVYRRVAVMPQHHVTLLDHHRHEHDVSLATQLIGDASNVDDLKRALRGIDVVFSTVGITHAAQFATALVQAMDAVGVKRLFWTTQFQINYDQISEAMYTLAHREFGFSREVETTYVAGQKAGAAVIRNSDLDYTLLACHFFKYNDEVDQLIVEPAGNAVSGGPLSLFSLATLITDMLEHPQDYPQRELMISAWPGEK
jgi:putative NADH-flavin reductase